MDRKFVIALSSLAGSLMLSEAHAIGLGEIRLRSALNEPLRADIKLVQVNDLSENQIIVGLAPKEDFDRAHVDRDFLLNSLRFRLDLDDPKNPKVVVTTQQPLREPFLNFLVEVQWPSGRLLREYTLLMDLPAFSDNTKGGAIKEAAVPSGRGQPKDEGVSEVDAKPVKAPAPRVTAPKAQSGGVSSRRATPEEAGSNKGAAAAAGKEAPIANDKVSTTDNTYGPTNSSDTMWRIAQSVRGAGSVQQKILAIQRLNPAAFSNGNVNLLKKGQVLKLPSQEEIASIGKAEATAKFNEQNVAWKTGAKPAQAVGAQLDATGRAQAQAPAAAQPDGQLKLAAPAASSTSGQAAAQGSGGQPGAEVAALQNDLAVGMEELNRAQRENQEIASRAKDLDAQKENAERLLKLQSDEMAAMQAKLAAEQQAKAAADAAAAQATTDAQAKAAADAQAKAAADAAAAKAAADAQAKAAADAAAQAAADAQAKAAADAQAKAAADAAAAKAAADAQAKAAADDAAAKAAADAQAKAAAQPESPQQAAIPETPAPAIEQTPAPEVAPVAESTPATAPAAEATAPAPKAATPAPKAATPAKKVAPPVVESASESPVSSIVDSLKSNPVIGGIVAVVLIILALIGIRKRAGRPSVEAEEGVDESVIEYVAPEREEPELHAENIEASEEEQLVDTDWKTETAEVAEAPSAPVQPESGDVLGEADIYISFGNFDKGEALLKSAIASEPARTDYRLKLLELYKESGNLASFDEAYKGLIELDDDLAIARAGEMRSGVAGAASTPFSFGVSSAAAAEGISDEHEFDLDLDMDFDTPAEVHVVPAVQAAVAEPEAEESTFFDVDFDLDAEPGFASGATEVHQAVSAGAAPQPVEEPEEEFSLDFDLDLEAPVVQAAPEEVIPEIAPAVAEQEYTEQENAMLGAVTADAGEIDEDLGFLSDADESATKLDLARAYIDMGDKDGARDILAEVLEEGHAEQKREAQALLDSIG